MNQQFRSPEISLTTQAAEGLPRRRWTVAEIEELTRLGFFDEDERFELIGGEIVPMSAKGIRHEVLKVALIRFWAKHLPDEFAIAPETTFRMSEDTFVEPDFVFYRVSDGLRKLSPSTALLAVEIGDSSLSYDRGRKARLYAAFGIPEVWVIDAIKYVCYAYSRPAHDEFQQIETITEVMPLPLPFAPQVAIALSQLAPV